MELPKFECHAIVLYLNDDHHKIESHAELYYNYQDPQICYISITESNL